MTELAIPNWGALGALLLILWRTWTMTNATERLDASVARTLTATTDYTIELALKGASVSVVVNGVKRVSIYREYVNSVVDGLLDYYRRSRQ